MKKEWISYLRCPKDGATLELSEEVYEGEYITSGLLTSKSGNVYPIKNSVIEFFAFEKDDQQKQTIEMFGHEWKHYNQWGWLEDYPENTEESKLIYTGGLKREAQASFDNKAPFKKGALHKDAIVLDAGCGNGRHANISSNQVKLLFCLDASEAIYAARENLKDRENICFIRGDIFNLPFADNTFDAAYSIGVMQHTGSARSFTKSLLRVTKPNKPLTINCYGKGLLSYELIDWSMRKYITQKPKEKQMEITAKIAKFQRNLQTKESPIFKLLNKCLQTQVCIHTSDCIMYDWYAPSLAHHYTPKQIMNLVEEVGGKVEYAYPVDFTEKGYNDFKRKLFHRSFQFCATKNA